MNRSCLLIIMFFTLVHCAGRQAASHIEMDSHFENGIMFFEEKNYLRAEREFIEAISSNDHVLQSNIYLGEMYLDWGRYDESVARFKKVLKSDPYSAAALTGLAKVAIKENRLNEALQKLEEVIALDENYVEAIYFAGKIHAQQGSKDEAKVYFRRVLELKPGDIRAQLGLRELVDENSSVHVSSDLEYRADVTRAELANFIDVTFEIVIHDTNSNIKIADLDNDDVESSILDIVSNNIMQLENAKFRPRALVRRGELAQIGLNLLVYATNDRSLYQSFINVKSPYRDVSVDQSYFNAVILLTTYNIFELSESRLFEPERFVTGEEVVEFIKKLQVFL